MFAPRVAKPQPKTDLAIKLAPRLSMRVARFWEGAGANPSALQRRRAPLQGAAGASWDFSEISIFPPNQQSLSAPLQLQSKLAIGAVSDPLEREADRVADQVMRTPGPELSIAPSHHQISRKCAACEEEDKKTLQMKQTGAAADTIGAEAPPLVQDALRSPGQPLDVATRAFFEP